MRSVIATLIAVVVLGSGCESGKAARPTVQAGSAPGSLPACAHAGDAVARPDGFPASLPLPDGTVLTGRETGVKRAAVSGLVPLSLRDAAAWMTRALPDAGYAAGESDAEQDEAESFFTGHGLTGKWKLNALENCPGAVAIEISVSPTD